MRAEHAESTVLVLDVRQPQAVRDHDAALVGQEARRDQVLGVLIQCDDRDRDRGEQQLHAAASFSMLWPVR